MANNRMDLWLRSSRLVRFFTEFSAWPEHQDEALRQEYEDLFYGTNAAIYVPLWASVCKYEDGTLLDETTLKVVQMYHRWGYAPVEMDGNPPDFIGQQLRFLCYLLACAAYAETKGESAAAYTDAAEELITLYLLDTVRAVVRGIRQYASGQVFFHMAEELIAVCGPVPADRGESPEQYRQQLVCYETYENGPAPAIPDAPARVIMTAGRNNCGGKCSIRATEQDGCVIGLETGCDIGEPTLRACVRGRGYRKTYLTGQRLRYPMKRVGKRGEGRFRRISWEEAADFIAAEWVRIRDTYGVGSRYVNYGTGVSAMIRPNNLAKRLLAMDGGYLNYFGTYSSACAEYVTPYIYGDVCCNSSTESILETKLLILWGHNPSETIFDPRLAYTIARAKERGAKVIVIDPRYSDTAVALADEWVPITPSTDAALANAMAYVIWSEGLQDQTFMDRCCVGFDEAHMPEGAPKEQNFRNYLFGGLDGVVKTPEWAEPITGVPADTIRRLAREYAAAKPACLLPGLGYQRTGNGEQSVRAVAALTCLTGNVGILGGGAAGSAIVSEERTPSYSLGENPYPGKISFFQWLQAIEAGADMTREKDHIQGMERLEANVKMFFNLASNCLVNQHSDINYTTRVLQDESKCECIIGSDVFMTPSAKFVDILLPAPSFLEEDNIVGPWESGHYLLHNNQVVMPLFGCRNEYGWLGEVAKRLGLWKKWSKGRDSHTQWLEKSYEQLRKKVAELPPYAEFKAQGGYTYQHPNIYVAYEEQCRDPEAHPFNTPSGKIEIYSQRLADWNDPKIPALPEYLPCGEGPDDPLREKYPLQLIGWHTKRRCHSIHDNNPWLEEVDPQRMWIHPEDASVRGLATGDLAEICNDRGCIRMPVLVTDRIMPGVVAVAQGAWYRPDEAGIDTRGSINVLTSLTQTPLAKGNPQHTNLVEVTAVKS